MLAFVDFVVLFECFVFVAWCLWWLQFRFCWFNMVVNIWFRLGVFVWLLFFVCCLVCLGLVSFNSVVIMVIFYVGYDLFDYTLVDWFCFSLFVSCWTLFGVTSNLVFIYTCYELLVICLDLAAKLSVCSANVYLFILVSWFYVGLFRLVLLVCGCLVVCFC